VIQTHEATVAVAMQARLGEGPWWDEPRDRLLWVDIVARRIHTYAPASGNVSTAELPDPVAFIVGRGDGYLAGTAAGLVALDADLRPAEMVAVPPDLDGRRINDGACDPAGRVLFGTMDESGERTGTLWSHSPEDGLVAVVDGVGLSNGLGFSPDERTLYYVDSRARRLDAFRYDARTGRVSDRRDVWHLEYDEGLPDGLAVDTEGCVWVAIWGAGQVRRLTPDGRHVATVRVGAAGTTSCAFGGRRRDRLYITTAQEDGGDGSKPAGSLFMADFGVQGAQVHTAG
jgi:sugar lactone lactonase YvrE